MTKTLTTERLKQLAGFKGAPAWGAEERSMAAELLRYREAAETPSCWEIAGQLFTTKEEALKPGYRGTPEPLYDGPVLTDDREAQPVGVDIERIERHVLHAVACPPYSRVVLFSSLQRLFTATPAPAVPDDYQHLKNVQELYHGQEERLVAIAQRIKGASFDKYAYSSSQAIDVLAREIFGDDDDTCRAAMLDQPVSQRYKLPDGWKLVPIEATPEILQAGITAHCDRQKYQRPEDAKFVGPMESAYNAMLAAAPEGGNEK